MTYPIRHTHATFARFTLDGNDYAISTDDGVRGGLFHTACIADDIALSDSWLDDVARGSALQLRVLDRNDLAGQQAHQPLCEEPVGGMLVDVETVTAVTYSDGTTSEFVRQQQLTCTGRTRTPGAVVLTLADIEDTRLNALWPVRTYTVEDWPELLTSDAGRAVPNIAGLALKLSGALVDAALFRYALAENAVWVLTVYRGRGSEVGRVVDPSEYTVGNSAVPYAHTYVEFDAEQRDFDGGLFAITADCETTGSGVNPATEIDRLLTAGAAVTVDAASLAVAVAFAASHGIAVECDHGRAGQRTIRAIVEDLLWVCRATMVRNAAGNYALLVDDTGSAVASLDEDAGDAVELLDITEIATPAQVGIRYRPGPRDTGELQHTHMRAVAGGSLAAERPRELRYVWSHVVADRCAYYRAIRAALNVRIRARVYQRTLAVGDVINIASSAFRLSATDFRVRDVQSILGGVEIEATLYRADLVSYSAGTLPTDANDDYQPDYSQTPPLAPSSFRITATSTALQTDGTVIARVTADAIPPTANGNWSQIWIAAIHNTTAEITMAQAASVGGGRFGLVLTGLRPGEVYQLKCYAINAFGISGVVQGTFDATAIGGSGTATTFTTGGYATLPANVGSIAVAQGSALLYNVSWTAVTTANLREYVLERSVSAGSWAEVWRGQARSYVDRDLSYSSSYAYRVKARDTYGNVSAAWTTSGASTPTTGTIAGGITGNDIGNDTVATGNRTNKSTITQAYTNPGPGLINTYTINHGLSKDPLLTVDLGGKVTAIATLSNVSGSTADVVVMGAFQSADTTSVAPANPHSHSLFGFTEGGTISLRVW